MNHEWKTFPTCRPSRFITNTGRNILDHRKAFDSQPFSIKIKYCSMSRNVILKNVKNAKFLQNFRKFHASMSVRQLQIAYNYSGRYYYVFLILPKTTVGRYIPPMKQTQGEYKHTNKFHYHCGLEKTKCRSD